MATADKSESRRCPGEKYTITLAVCEARQANHYPKCLLCKYHGGRGGEGPSSDPKVKTSIFRTTSIAGRVPGEINEYVVRKVGTAAAQFLRAESGAVSSMVVGCDLRENSRNLGRIFCEGANTGGMHTAYVGTVPDSPLNSENDPLRGQKGTLYEGGTRVCAFANWPARLKPQRW